jgi:hypothetical protein
LTLSELFFANKDDYTSPAEEEAKESVSDQGSMGPGISCAPQSCKGRLTLGPGTRRSNLMSQDDDNLARKKPRHEEPFSASTYKAATKLSPHDTAVSLPAAAADNTDADGDPVKGAQATDRWTTEEDAKLIVQSRIPARRSGTRITGQIGLPLPRWSLVEQKYSAAFDGAMPWIPASTE